MKKKQMSPLNSVSVAPLALKTLPKTWRYGNAWYDSGSVVCTSNNLKQNPH